VGGKLDSSTCKVPSGHFRYVANPSATPVCPQLQLASMNRPHSFFARSSTEGAVRREVSDQVPTLRALFTQFVARSTVPVYLSSVLVLSLSSVITLWPSAPMA
jgi:hypothetical protein